MELTKSWAMIIAVYIFSAALGTVIIFAGYEITDSQINFAGQLILTLTGSTSAAGAFVGGMKHRNQIKEIVTKSKDLVDESKTEITEIITKSESEI